MDNFNNGSLTELLVIMAQTSVIEPPFKTRILYASNNFKFILAIKNVTILLYCTSPEKLSAIVAKNSLTSSSDSIGSHVLNKDTSKFLVSYFFIKYYFNPTGIMFPNFCDQQDP